MKVINLYPGAYASDCYYVTDDGGTGAVLIDPSADPEAVWARLPAGAPSVGLILLTHAHFDHMLGLAAWRAHTGAPVAVFPSDAPAFSDPGKNCYRFFFSQEETYAPPERLLLAGELIPVGAESLRVLHTPGHTPGSCSFDSGECLFTGDTLFAEGGVGRCDLPGGDIATLRRSLSHLLGIPGERLVYPGHGEPFPLSAAKQIFGQNL